MSATTAPLGARRPPPPPRPRWRSWILPAAVLCFLGSLVSGLAGGAKVGVFPDVLLGAGLVLFGVEIALSWRSVRDALFRRATFYDLNALLQVAAVFAILTLLNHLAWRRSERVAWMPKWDLTRRGEHTFAKQTLEVLARLDKRKSPVEVVAFFLNPKGDSQQEKALRGQRGKVKGLLERYAQKTDKFRFELIDPEVDPLRAKKEEVRVQGTVILKTAERRIEVLASELFTGDPRLNQRRRFKGEQVFTSKLLDILDGTKRTVYFLTGRLGGSVESDAPDGYSRLRQELEVDGFAVKKTNLLIQEEVPEDCTVLVVAGPQQDLSEIEILTIRRFLDRRGPVFFLVDAAPYLPRLAGLIGRYGAKVTANLVIEPDPKNRIAGQPMTPMADLNGHAITNPLMEDDLRVVFHEATALDHTAAAREKYDVRTILQGSPEAWGETDLSLSTGGVRLDPEDLQPPLSLAFAISSRAGSNDGLEQKPADELRVVVHGDSSYIRNDYLAYPANRDFFLNSLRWLSRDIDRITIRPKVLETAVAELPEGDEFRLFFGLTFGLPAVFLGLGFAVWWQRRSR